MRDELRMFLTSAFVNPHRVCIRIPNYLCFSEYLETAVTFFSFNEMFCSTASPFVSCPLMKLPCWWWQIFSTDHQIAVSQEKIQFGCTITALASVFLWFMHVNATKEYGFTGHTHKHPFELTHNMAVVLFLMIILMDSLRWSLIYLYMMLTFCVIFYWNWLICNSFEFHSFICCGYNGCNAQLHYLKN